MTVGKLEQQYRQWAAPRDGVLKTLRTRKLRNYTWVGIGLFAYWIFWFLMLTNQVNYNQMHPAPKRALDRNGIAIDQAQ
jgi:hypothetical protein